MTLKPKILKHNVTAVKIKFDNGICWKVGTDNYVYNGINWKNDSEKYVYGWAYSRATDGGLFDVLHAPDGTELKGDIIILPEWFGRNSLTAFQPHDNQVTRKQSLEWDRCNWTKHTDGRDDLFYNDIDYITYKNPKSKTGRLRTDRVYTISIQEKIYVIVYRKNGKRDTMNIPIELVVEKHQCKFDENGHRIPIV